ncbi:MAG: hypothetical protein JW892_15790 [Anaerolineae bacterium]|nr:hypothetical protein [Anaerolineae bacterium]
MTNDISDDSLMDVHATRPLPETQGEQSELRPTVNAVSLSATAPKIRRSAPAFLWVVAVVGLLTALLSLGINAVLIRELLGVRQEGQVLLEEAIAELDQFSLEGMHIAYTFSDTIHYSGTIPISQTIDFPFEGNVPFRGEVPIVINVPLLGSQTIRVPVDTSVYVNTVIRVPVRMDFPFDVQMPIQLPIEMDFSNEDFPALGEMVGVFRELLLEVRALFWRE